MAKTSSSSPRVKADITITDVDGVDHRAVIFRGSADHHVKAQQMAKGDPGQYQLALASLLVELDGERLKPDDWRQVDMEVFVEVSSELVGGGKSVPTPEAPPSA